MRMGVHTGLIVFGSVGGNLHMDPTAIGDAANIAARFQHFGECAGDAVVLGVRGLRGFQQP